ncbi:3-hydroxyacyl-CoA dehydrogenase NAD-binding domain-containing protein [Micromonospora sp. MSM11]|nr:3-hydroxyacyl-CoA dehydrogenase NAD-binding domain-containing protein [Micromonospora sp. MSM11]MCL7456332.1 3-hydroxyacyl-CoA dehydrogenase NAD-binding domain-containing protein [Micromonospora sp. MSM11]
MGDIETVGVVGAGVMGTGVSQALAEAGLSVVLVDLNTEILDRARREIGDGVRLRRLLAGTGGNRTAVLERISWHTDLDALAEVDFVIENVTEDWAVKQPVYERLDEVCRPDTVLAANTSVIAITALGGLTRRPQAVLGMHFMNPVPLRPMVEVIRGHHTSDETVARGRFLLERLGKEAVVVADSPGFVSNRVLMLTINEAAFLLQERVADAAEIDRLFRGCFGHRMGPLETADLIGLDTIVQSIEGLHEAFADSKYRPCPLLRRMVQAGLHGRKSGAGFYSYAGAGDRPAPAERRG